MNNEEIQDRYKLVKDFITKAGDWVMDSRDKLEIVSQEDGGANPTSNLDIEVEKRFFDLITNNFPDDGWVGEELIERNNTKEFTWYIDPIDGTKYMVKDVPLWCVTIALMKGNDPILGFVYNPSTKSLYSAVEKGGAFKNDTKITVSNETETKRLQVVWDYTDLSEKLGKEELSDLDYPIFNSQIYEELLGLYKNFYRVRNLGTSALSLVWVASGMYGAYYSPLIRKSKIVDFAAGMLIAKEAGAVVYWEDISSSTLKLIVGVDSSVNIIKSMQMSF